MVQFAKIYGMVDQIVLRYGGGGGGGEEYA